METPTIKKEFDDVEKLLETQKFNSADKAYLEAVQRTLGWILGIYDSPIDDYKR
jgi:hypothetical protein